MSILDFDPSRSDARDDLDLLVEHIHTVYPIVLYGKMRDPWHRKIQKMLAGYRITPTPLIVDIDQRRDWHTFESVLHRLLDVNELPQLVIRGKVIGSYHHLLDLKDTGTLALTLQDHGGITLIDAVKKKKGIKERERLENERILQPAPIIGD